PRTISTFPFLTSSMRGCSWTGSNRNPHQMIFCRVVLCPDCLLSSFPILLCTLNSFADILYIPASPVPRGTIAVSSYHFHTPPSNTTPRGTSRGLRHPGLYPQD